MELTSPAKLRWRILRRSLLSRSSSAADAQDRDVTAITRIPRRSFCLIQGNLVDNHFLENAGIQLAQDSPDNKDMYFSYELPGACLTKLILVQRKKSSINLLDFEVSARYNIDSTGLVCCWPSEEILTYYCLKHRMMFRSKRILELGSGCGLAGFMVAVCSDASTVVISDGNPEVVGYIKRNISINSDAFGETEVKSMVLHWNQCQPLDILNSFDVIIASDCTFFKDFHVGLANTVKSLLKQSESSEAIFVGPRRGGSLDEFISVMSNTGLSCELIESYDETIWNLHKKYASGDDDSWPNYDPEHCYPLLLRIKFVECNELM